MRDNSPSTQNLLPTPGAGGQSLNHPPFFFSSPQFLSYGNEDVRPTPILKWIKRKKSDLSAQLCREELTEQA